MLKISFYFINVTGSFFYQTMLLRLLIEEFINIQNKISKISGIGTCDQLDGG